MPIYGEYLVDSFCNHTSSNAIIVLQPYANIQLQFSASFTIMGCLT